VEDLFEGADVPPAIIGGAISAGSSLLGGLLGHSASSKAGNTIATADRNASSSQLAAGTQAQNALQGEIGNASTTLSPYTTLGSSASTQLQSQLPSLTQGYNQTFSAPTAAQAEATPGYQFQVQQATNALQNSAAARGGLLSTGTAKNLASYVNGLASTNYQNTFNNALQAFNTNENTYYTNQNNAFNKLYSTTGLGQNAAENLNSTQAGLTNALANSITGNQQVANQDLMGGAQAQAAGTVGGTNALTSGLAGAGSAIGQGVTLQGILGASNASNTYVPSVNNGTFSYSGGTEAGTGFTPPSSGTGLWNTNALVPQDPNPFGNQLPVGAY
jgi:hypothetical protein